MTKRIEVVIRGYAEDGAAADVAGFMEMYAEEVVEKCKINSYTERYGRDYDHFVRVIDASEKVDERVSETNLYSRGGYVALSAGIVTGTAGFDDDPGEELAVPNVITELLPSLEDTAPMEFERYEDE